MEQGWQKSFGGIRDASGEQMNSSCEEARCGEQIGTGQFLTYSASCSTAIAFFVLERVCPFVPGH